MISNAIANMAKYKSRPGDLWANYRKGTNVAGLLPSLRAPAKPAAKPAAAPAAKGPTAADLANFFSQKGPAAPLPSDSLYIQGTANNQKIHDQTVAGLKGHQQGLTLDYGVDAGGHIADNVDVTNPFSKAALLKKSFQNAQRGNTNGMAAQGQLYSGALQNAQVETGRQNLQGIDALLKNFAAEYGGDTAAIGQADTDLGSNNLKELGDLLGRQTSIAPPDPVPGPSAAELKHLFSVGGAIKRTTAAAKPAGKKAPSVLYLPAAHRRLGGGAVTGGSRNRLTKTKTAKVVR